MDSKRHRRRRTILCSLLSIGMITAAGSAGYAQTVREYPVPAGSGPHDVAPAPDGGVWYTAQRAGELGLLDPATGSVRRIPLGPGSRPHGVIVGPDGAPWVTDGGLNAIVRVDPVTLSVKAFPLPANRSGADLNTAAFDSRGVLWFTGQRGVYGSLDPKTGRLEVFDAPRGRGPYGIDASPDGSVYYVSLAAGYVGKIEPATGRLTVLDPPTPGQGTRRVWADSRGVLWISGWYSGKLLRLEPGAATWQEIAMPGRAQPYAVYVDELDKVWLSDYATNAIVRYDPVSGSFTSFPLPSRAASVRQILGRPGEIWAAGSAVDKLVVVRY